MQLKLWVYYSPAQYHAWVYLAEPKEHRFPCELVGTLETTAELDRYDLRLWICRRIHLLGFPRPPFLNIDHNALFGNPFT